MSKLLLDPATAKPAERPSNPAAGGGGRPDIDYTLNSQDVLLLDSALQHYKEYLQSIAQTFRKSYALPSVENHIVRCRELQDKFSRGFETVIRDIS